MLTFICSMPDHCHLLIEGKSEESDLWQCVVNFKRKSGYWLARNHPLEEWQKDFYDHILRKDEDLIKQVRYILGNPLRKELVEDWRAYPYKTRVRHYMILINGENKECNRICSRTL